MGGQGWVSLGRVNAFSKAQRTRSFSCPAFSSSSSGLQGCELEEAGTQFYPAISLYSAVTFAGARELQLQLKATLRLSGAPSHRTLSGLPSLGGLTTVGVGEED